MVVKCLGCGDAFGSGGRFNTSYYLKTSSLGVLLDCGASTLIALKRENLSTDDVDVIVISHLHGDHFGGLAFILCEILALELRRKPLTIIGPEETKTRTEQALRCFFPGVEIKEDSGVEFVTYTKEEKLQFEGITIIAYPAIHSPDTHPHILRIEADDQVICFSGDTEWTEDLIRASQGSDLFICEASTYKTSVKHHMSVKQLLEQIKRIETKNMILTHLGEDVLEHLDQIPFAVATDGAFLMGK